MPTSEYQAIQTTARSTLVFNECSRTSFFFYDTFSPVYWAHNLFCPFPPAVFLIFWSKTVPHEIKETVLSKACQRRWVLPSGNQSFNGSVGSEHFFFIKLSKVISSLQNVFPFHPPLCGWSKPGCFNV